MPTPDLPKELQFIDPELHAHSLLSRMGEVPTALRNRASSFVTSKYQQLSERYGPTEAKAILSATLLLLPVPLPGTSLLPIALAEGVKQLSALVTGGGRQTTEAMELLARQVGLSLEELGKASQELLHEARGIDQLGEV